MAHANYRDLRQGITCIDANYGGQGLACFYLLEQDGACAIIETGTAHSLDNLRQCLADKNLQATQVQYVIPTHVHLDHAGGAGAMMQLFDQATLLVHPRGARHLIDPARLVASSIEVYGRKAFKKLYGDIVPVDPRRVVEVDDEFTFELSGRRLLARHTPGHADHHFCVWDESSRGWFSGDMFGVSYDSMRFANGDFVMPSTTPTQFRPDAYLESVALLESYRPQRMYLTHYGELTYSEQLARLLCHQVRAYRDIAPDFQGQPEAMVQFISDHTLERMATLNPPGGAESLRAMVQDDVRLNALGLEVWLGRTLKNAGAK